MTKRNVDSPRKRMRSIIHRPPMLAPNSIQSLLTDASDDVRELFWIAEAKRALKIEPLKKMFVGNEILDLPEDWVDWSALSMQRLFDHFGLDPNQPSHWSWLVQLFAYVEFWEGSKRKRGRPKRWTASKLKELADAASSLPSKAEAARVLSKQKRFAPSGLRSGSGRHLRRKIAEAN